MSGMLPIAFTDLPLLLLYLATLLLGVGARYRGKSFGMWHHTMFFITCAAFIVSALGDLRLAHAPAAAVLVAMPLTRPRRSRRHDAVGVLGLLCMILLLATA